MGAGTTPEKFKTMLDDPTDQDCIILGLKDSIDANIVSTKMTGNEIEPKSIAFFGMEMDVYLV